MGSPRHGAGGACNATTSYRQHKGNTVAPAGAGGSAGTEVGGEGAAPPPAPATSAKPVQTRAEWEAALPNQGFIGWHIAQPPKPPKQVSVTEGGMYMTEGRYKRELVYERGQVYVNERTGQWVRESWSVYDRKWMLVPVGSRGFVRASTCEWFSVGEQRECVRVHVSERASLCVMR